MKNQDIPMLNPENKTPNPANTGSKRVTEHNRIPMSLPILKLSVPEIPGYHLHWMLGTPQRIAQAQRAGYEFVDPEEVEVVNSGLADDTSVSGNTDMGSRVSISAGRDTEDRLYLMKLKQEWWEQDQKKQEEESERIAATMRGGSDLNANPHGIDNRYIPESMRKNVQNLFIPKTRRI